MDGQNLKDTWIRICNQIASYDDVNTSELSAFFSRLHPQAMSDDFLMLTAENDFIKDYIEKKYLSFIYRALKDLFNTDFNVEIEIELLSPAGVSNIQHATTSSSVESTKDIATQSTKQEDKNIGVQNQQNQQSQQKSSSKTPDNSAIINDENEKDTNKNTSATKDSSEDKIDKTPDTQNDPGILSSLTFENFVIGDSNRVAYTTAVRVAEHPGQKELNPLFIYGRSGLGKTHLLRAIQNYILLNEPKKTVVYTDSAEFLIEYTNAAIQHDREKSSFKNFKTKYENADVLLIDDVQFFQGKKETLDVMFQIFNRLTSDGKQIVLSADRSPKNIDIDERYSSRFSQGGVFDIRPPELETKIGIIRNYIDEFKESEEIDSLNIPQDVEIYIAENSSSNIRELKGAVTKVVFEIFFQKQENISIDDVKELLDTYLVGGVKRRISVAEVQNAVETFYKVTHTDLIGKKRGQNIAYPRHVAVYLCRSLLSLPHSEIGKCFNRDHSTIMTSVDKIEKMLKTNRETREEVEAITQIIKEM